MLGTRWRDAVRLHGPRGSRTPGGMTARFARVPEWLLEALGALAPEDRPGVSPATAVAVFAAVAARHADYRTGEARLDPGRRRDVADVLGVTERSVRRTLAVLAAVGAIRPTQVDRWVLEFDPPSDVTVRPALALVPGVRSSDVTVRSAGRPRPLMVSVSAGQSPNPEGLQRAEFSPESIEDSDDAAPPPEWARGPDKLGTLRAHLGRAGISGVGASRTCAREGEDRATGTDDATHDTGTR